jgi:hypothetical protein
MYEGRTVFAQIMDFVPRHAFDRCVRRYKGNFRVRTFRCWDQFLCMAFAQLTARESLRDVEACLRSRPGQLYHMGIRGKISRSTLAEANEKRDWRIYADFAQVLIAEARRLYAEESFSLELDETVYALDSTTIELCLSLFPWARFRKRKGGVKMHTLLDLRGQIPVFVTITHALVHDVRILDALVPEPGAIYVMDRAYIDFARLYRLDEQRAFFVTRAKKNLQFRRLYSHPVERTTGLVCDQTIRLTGFYSSRDYPDQLRRVRYRDPETGRRLTFLTNNTSFPALTVAELYRCRWQVELFFKWIKQHLRIKSFYGTSENAVKTQIWIAISAYVLIAILRKKLGIDRNLYTILQILSLSLFEKVPLSQVLTEAVHTPDKDHPANQLPLFDL